MNKLRLSSLALTVALSFSAIAMDPAAEACEACYPGGGKVALRNGMVRVTASGLDINSAALELGPQSFTFGFTVDGNNNVSIRAGMSKEEFMQACANLRYNGQSMIAPEA